jgi:hypothetical protein
VNVADDGAIFLGKMFHRAVFTPILKRPKEFVFKRNTARTTAKLVTGGIGNSENFEHFVKGGLRHAKEFFELAIA